MEERGQLLSDSLAGGSVDGDSTGEFFQDKLPCFNPGGGNVVSETLNMK